MSATRRRTYLSVIVVVIVVLAVAGIGGYFALKDREINKLPAQILREWSPSETEYGKVYTSSLEVDDVAEFFDITERELLDVCDFDHGAKISPELHYIKGRLAVFKKCRLLKKSDD